MIQFPFPVFITKEGKWFVAECPMFMLATQGKTEKEVRENMRELIEDYLADPHTPKKSLQEIGQSLFTYLSVPIAPEVFYGKNNVAFSK